MALRLFPFRPSQTNILPDIAVVFFKRLLKEGKIIHSIYSFLHLNVLSKCVTANVWLNVDHVQSINPTAFPSWPYCVSSFVPSSGMSNCYFSPYSVINI